jgi:voltage-dependent anion channel protein 2
MAFLYPSFHQRSIGIHGIHGGFFVQARHAQAQTLMYLRGPLGLTLTQAWTTANTLDTKLELDNTITKGLKAEVLTHFLPSTQAKGAKLNLYFKQPSFHARAFFDLLKGPTANVDAVLGHDGFLVGAEAGYDVQKAAITRYSAAVGYTVPEYTAAITATNNLSIFSASYFHKVNSQVEAGAKASWDSKGTNQVGLEVASKYRLDPTSFAKVSQACSPSSVRLSYTVRR